MARNPDPVEVAAQAVDRARAAGAQASDAYASFASQLQLEVRRGSLENLQQATTRGLGLRVQVDGRVALVHTTDLSTASLGELAAKAVEIARNLPRSGEPLQLAEPRSIAPQPHQDPGLRDQTIAHTTDWLAAAEQAMAKVPGVTEPVAVSWEQIDGTVALVNSLGLRVAAPFCSLTINADAIAERDGQTSSGGCYLNVPARSLLPPPEWVGGTAGSRAVELLGARTIPSAKVPVIFPPHVGWTLLACLANALRGDHVVQGRSYMADQMGADLASPLVTIRDMPHDLRGPGHRAFDGEGTPTRDTTLIDQGRVAAFLTDRASAAKLGRESGGNATRDSYTQAPSIGISNLHLEPGAVAPEEIIARTQRGLLVTVLSGWWVNMSPATDGFSSAAMGIWVENGAPAYPVRGITIAGTVRQMLSSVDMIGNDFQILGTICAPTFRVSEMTVSGT